MKKLYVFVFLMMSLAHTSCAHLPWVEKVKVMPLTGKVEFTDKYDPEASVCIPAAYTGPDGNIEGLYRIKGVTYGTRSLKELVSLHPDKGIVISRQWMSSNGFQQHVLVKNGKMTMPLILTWAGGDMDG